MINWTETFGAMTLKIATLSTMTLTIYDSVYHTISEFRYADSPCAKRPYEVCPNAMCTYAECLYSECLCLYFIIRKIF